MHSHLYIEIFAINLDESPQYCLHYVSACVIFGYKER